MAEGNGVAGVFSGHDSSDDGGMNDGAFFCGELALLELSHDFSS